MSQENLGAQLDLVNLSEALRLGMVTRDQVPPEVLRAIDGIKELGL